MREILLLLLTILLAACNLPHSTPDLESIPVSKTPNSDTGYPACAWNWATQSLPGLGAELQSALESAGMKGVTASAEAYGENCATATGLVDHFATLETDFHITVQVIDITDTDQLGDMLEQILNVLNEIPADLTPGPQPGYVGVRFVQATEEINLWFTVTAGESGRALGLQGASLFSELQK